MMRRTPLIPVAVAALSLLVTAFAPAANAATEEELATGLVFPLSVAVSPDGTAYVAQNFGSMLTKVVPGEEPEVIFADEGQREVGAVSVAGDAVTFATTGEGSADVYTLTPAEGGGLDQTHVADLFAYENEANPDGTTKYGIAGLKKSCKKEFKKGAKAFLPYKGIVESHPYASITVGDTLYVADAAANAIFAIDGEGAVSTAAVLPPTKVTVKKKIRKAYGIPKCAQGKTLRVEGVPTDVEAFNGVLFVTSLPGGPEDPSVMGANGAVYAIADGTAQVYQSGLVSPTGLAIDSAGTAYVSSLFLGVIFKQPLGGEPEVFAQVPMGPGDVEVIDGYVYATDSGFFNDGPPAGRLLRWSTAP
jgi:sugar lactone lactonase YvrE